MKVEADRLQGTSAIILSDPHVTPEDAANAKSLRAAAAAQRAVADRYHLAAIQQGVRDADNEIREAEIQALHDALRLEDELRDLESDLLARRGRHGRHGHKHQHQHQQHAKTLGSIRLPSEMAVQGFEPFHQRTDLFEIAAPSLTGSASGHAPAEPMDFAALIEEESRGLEEAKRVSLLLDQTDPLHKGRGRTGGGGGAQAGGGGGGWTGPSPDVFGYEGAASSASAGSGARYSGRGQGQARGRGQPLDPQFLQRLRNARAIKK